MSDLLKLRDATSVSDLQTRDALVRRIKTLRAEIVIERNTLLHWNSTHPNDEPFDTSFYEAMILWCDGKGPMPKPQELHP